MNYQLKKDKTGSWNSSCKHVHIILSNVTLKTHGTSIREL